tara:strand:- start:133 stop:858 length:726 start_codon:yes stop_codon:yes gene_type:complete
MLDEKIVDKLPENLPFKMDTDFGVSSVLNKKKLLSDFGNYIIKVQKSIEDYDLIVNEDFPVIQMSIKNYVKDYLDEEQDSYYFKSEDDYDFLLEIGLKRDILDKYNFGKNGRLSFWWGNKNTMTSFHYDSYGYKPDRAIKKIHGEDFYKKAYGHSILTVLEGKKKVYIIHPKYSEYLKYSDSLQNGAAWCLEQTEDILNNKNIEYETIILNAGESLNIPMFWWHKIENLEQGMAITYGFSL